MCDEIASVICAGEPGFYCRSILSLKTGPDLLRNLPGSLPLHRPFQNCIWYRMANTMIWRLAFVTLAVLSTLPHAAVAAVGRPSPKPSPPPRLSCPTALVQLADYNVDGGVFSKFFRILNQRRLNTWFTRRYELIQKEAPLDRPPALILPTNAAMNQWLVQKNASLLPERWNSTTDGPFKRAATQLIVPFSAAERQWPKYFVNCTLLGLTQDMASPLDGMQLDLWNGKGPGLEGSRLIPGHGSASGRRLSQSTSLYGALGQGYNTLNGFPMDYSNNGVDAGFTGNPIFDIADTSTGTYGSTASCTQTFTTIPYYTAAQLQTYATDL